MKKACMVLILVAFLVFPVFASEKMKLTFNVGGMITAISQGYDINFTEQLSEAVNLSWDEALADIGNSFGFDMGIGIYLLPHFELYASYSSCGGIALGDYSFSYPYVEGYVQRDYVHRTLTPGIMTDVEHEYKTSVINFGFAFHLSPEGKIDPYIGFGASRVSAKLDLFESATLKELWIIDTVQTGPADMEVEIDGKIDIMKVELEQVSASTWGFHIKAGINVKLAKNIAIFAEGRYLNVSAIFNRLDLMFNTNIRNEMSWYYEEEGIDEWWAYDNVEQWKVENIPDLEIKIGGVQAIVGIKIVF